VLDMALKALAAANPASPLLDKNTRELMRRRHIASALAPKGYQFDIERGEVIGKNR